MDPENPNDGKAVASLLRSEDLEDQRLENPLQIDVAQLDLALTRILVNNQNHQELEFSSSTMAASLSDTLGMIFALAEQKAGDGGIEQLLQEEGLWALVEEVERKIEAEEDLIENELRVEEELVAVETAILIEEMRQEEEILNEIMTETVGEIAEDVDTQPESLQMADEQGVNNERDDSNADGYVNKSDLKLTETETGVLQNDLIMKQSVLKLDPTLMPVLQNDPVMKQRYAKYRAFSINLKPPPKPQIQSATTLNNKTKATALRASAPPIFIVTPIRPPKLPAKADIIRASWARPQCNSNPTSKAQLSRRRNFMETYTITQRGLPTPPDPPSALTACPPPGKPLIAHQLRLRGLPLKCTEGDILDFLGAEHAGNIMSDWDEDGFQGGVKILKRPDGWPAGEAIVKFVDKLSAMRALPDAHGRNLGRRRIQAVYLRIPTPPNRGRILITGIKGKTSPHDIAIHFSGWDLATDEAGAPQIVTDSSGVLTGEAIVIFATEAAAERALRDFDFERPIHGRRIGAQWLPPVELNEITNEWEVEGDFDDDV